MDIFIRNIVIQTVEECNKIFQYKCNMSVWMLTLEIMEAIYCCLCRYLIDKLSSDVFVWPILYINCKVNDVLE